MPGMKAVGEEDKHDADQQYEQSDESETRLLLLHVVAVLDEDERRHVSHAYRWISSSTFGWLGVSHHPLYHGSLKSSVSQAVWLKWWIRPRCKHCFIFKVNRLLKNITFPITSSVGKGNKVRVELGWSSFQTLPTVTAKPQNIAIENICVLSQELGAGSKPSSHYKISHWFERADK